MKQQPPNRVKQVIVAIAKGKCLKEIALEWNRSVKTAEGHWAEAKRRYGFQCYVDAARYAYRHHWAKP